MTKHTATPSHALPKLKPLVASLFTWVQRPGTLALTLGAMPALALANMPTGGKVVAGAATISNPDGNTTIINQASDKAVLNWQSFSIGEGGHVQFVQRDANSVALNRVVGSDPSSILGNLSANGQIFLVNQNGIFFGHSAKVDVAGIVATTLDIKDEDFMRGDYRFSRGANAPARATVINEGALNANGGYVVLAGDYAANKGIVQAQLGTVLLASGDSLTLQMAGSSLINYQVDKATVAHLAGVENSGQILANGGRVIMTADVAQDLASTVVNNSGLIQAQSAVEKNGAIYFEGNGGNVANSGTLDASAQAGASGAHGGHVEIRSTGDIAHEAGSKIDVSGAAEGVSDAGSVNTWADGSNRYKEGASIAARGGAQGGNGGEVELSGNNVVNRSIVDLSAANGQLGTLTLDPLAITVADGAGTNTEDGATIYEQNLEAQLKVGNVSLLATGQDASITVADLSDGAIDGSNNGAGGSLTLRAEGSGNPAIRFIDRNDMILVDKAIDISTGDLEAPASGSIDVGHLNAGTRIDLASGSIRAASLTVDKVIDTQSDNSFAINARATQGDLTVDNDVSLNVRNLKAGALSTTVTLRADNGDVNLGAAVESKATGLGYYNYNWTTAGNDATTYYGQQPWTMVSQADHPILATLNIQAGGSVRAGEVNVLALDKNIAFDTTPGGYWQTATATQHNFWRATGAKAVGTVNAGADVTIAGKTSVKADGYATASYGETEAWRAMVSNFNYTSGSQTVITTRSDGHGGTTETRTTNNYNNVKGSVKGAGSERYIWSFGPYSTINGSTVYNSANVSSNTDSASGSDATDMSYTGVAGMSANLSVNAAGSVAMKGLEVRSTNRSGTGSGSFTDAYWGRQDTAANISGTGSSFTSAQAEIDYKDVFQTGYTAATSTANASISAGDNASVTIGEHSDVIAEHTLIDAATNNLAGATMSVSAGSLGGATGSGLVSIAGGVNVQGASGSDVSLTIRNDDGNIELTGADSSVTNTYVGADARAQLTANSGRIDTQGIAVSGGHAAYLDATAGAGITLAGTASTLVTSSGSNGAAAIRISAGGDVSAQDIRATSNNGQQTTNGFSSWTIDGGTASVAVQSSGGDIGLHGDVRAEGYESATISVAASGIGARLSTDAGTTVDASTNATRYDSSEWGGYYNQPTYLATTNLEAAAGIDLGGDVGARLAGRNGDAYVGITTTGGKDAAIVQAAGTTIGADGARATVNISAGAQSPNGDNGAEVDLQGRVSAQARTDAAMITVSAAGGTLHDFSAQSDANAASLTVNAVDAAGTLTIDGQGNIGANFDNVAGAALNVYGSGAVDAASSRISVSNFAGSSNAGARATLNANHGDLQLGELSVSGAVSAMVGAHASGALDSHGPVSAMANGYNGYAGISLDTTAGAITVADGGAVAASAYSNGSANLSVSSGAGLALNDDISAYTFGAGSARITATTATNAAIDQDAGTRILANGGSADISLTTGAFDLQGSVQASASSLPASLSVNGTSGSIGDFGVSSSASAATATINASNGDLTLAGNGNVNGAVSANLNATASGKLDVRGQLDTVQNGIFGTAQTNLVSSGGNLLVGADAALSTRANGMMANATLNLTGASGMTLEGDLAATASGSAAVSLVTTGGSDAAIVQDAGSAITANGNSATIGVKAGNGAPVAANAAALALAGSLQATGGTAAADIAITGAGGSVHSAIAQSSGAASVGIAAVGADARLAIDGEVSASANVNSPNGAELSIDSSGAIDTRAASLAAVNLGGGAQAQLTAHGDNALGALAVRGTGAVLNASAGGLLGVNGALLAEASGAGGQAQVTLSGDSATTVASGASVSASAGGAEGAAIVNLASAAGITVDGAVNATASGNGGDASINLLATDGDIALNAGLNAAASDIAAVGITGASGDIGANANIDAIGGGAGTIALQALDGSLTQAAGATLHAGARNGMVQVDLASRGALRIDGDILAAATTNGGADGQHSGSATVNLVTTGGALSGITQDAGSTVEALGLSAAIRIAAGSHFPGDDIANSAAFQLDGTLRAIDAMGGARLEIAGASGSVNDFSVEASNAPANATITALRGDLVLDGNANVSGQSGGASLRVEANGALDTSAATVAVTNGGSDGADYADASFDAYGGNAKLGQTTVAAIGGTASLYAASTGSLELAADLGAISLLDAGYVNLSTTGGAEATLGQGAGTTIAARGGSDASVRISAGSSKAGARALYTLDGDIQAGAMNGQATIDIDGAGGSVHDFSVLSTRGAAAVTITGVDSSASVVLDGSGSVTGTADDIQGAWLNVTAEGALDTSAATLSADNALAGESGGARLELHANGGNAVLGDASVSGTRVAALDASASGDLRVSGALASTASAVAGTATTDLRADGQAIIGADGSAAANANAASGYAAVTVGGAQGVGVAGSLAAQAASQARINVTAGSGDIALDGALQALSARNASVGVNALDGKLTQSAAGTIHAGGGNGTGQADLTSRGAMRIDGQVAAAATADGTVNGQHTGSAVANLTTTGGASASITQGAGSTIEAVGRAAYLTVKAGDSDMGRDASATAAFDLGGTLRAVDAIGGSRLAVGGASGRVHDFSVTAQNAPASAVFTAFNGDVVLDGTGNVVANTSSSAGASLRIDASGTIDTTAAQIGIANLSGDDGASAGAELYAQGSAKLGNMDVSANASAQLTAVAGSDLTVAGRLSAAGTAAYGEAGIDLSAANALTVGSTGVVNVTGGGTMGSASLNLDGSHGVNVAGSLNAYANEAAIGLQASAGNVVLDGALAAQGGDRASIEALAGGTLAQSAASRVHSGATNGVAEAYLSSTGAMTVAGRVSAAATQDGSVDGAHSGAALVGLSTTGGAGATVTQASSSTIEAVGLAARLGIAAGSGSPVENTDKAAAFTLDGTLRAIDDFGGSTLEIAGASGSVHDFTVAAANATAKASITAVNGNLAFNGKGDVTGNAERSAGASLLAQAKGNIDTTAAVLNVANANAETASGAAATLQAGANLALGPVSVTGANAALDASAAGKLDVMNALAASGKADAGIKLAGEQGVTLGAALNAGADRAYIDVTAASGNVALNSAVTALGGDRASVAVQALNGSLTQAAGTTITAGATSGVAEVDLSSSGALAVNGKILAAATADGTASGAHTGAALIGITTTGGAAAGISQSQASSIEAVGRSARLAINAGSANPADDVTKAAAFKLDGTLRAIDEMGGSSLQIAGASGSVHDFTVAAANATAQADIAAVNGDLVLSGTGTVSGNADEFDGASLKLSASGSLDTSGTTLKVSNVNSGEAAGAQAVLLASTGAAKLGVAKVTAHGGGTAAFQATAGTTLVATAKLDAENLGLGTAAGNALVKLNTTGKTGVTSTVTQDSGATITAATQGNAGNATVDIQAGNCCNSAVVLNDTVKAVVDGGTGSASIAARGNTVTVKDLTANVLAAGTGNSMVSLAAPTEVKLAGTIDSQAAASTARARVQLVSDKLTDGATFKLSKGNGHVQLTPFSTGKIIGVHSDKDFDETADVNYNLVTLKKFMTQGAELTFGGEFDRSAWLDPVTGEVCLPGMEAWASQLQHTGAIHVAGNGRLNLGDVKMVFDTTGITTYHDPKLSAWSVPTGRVATLVVPPSNVDRYLDRTDNTVQNMNKVVQDTTATTRSSGAVEAGQLAPRGTQISGKLFMDGNGVNMARNDAAEGSQADAQGPESKSRQHGDSTEQ